MKIRKKLPPSVIVVLVASIAIASATVVLLLLRSTNPTIIEWGQDPNPVIQDDTLAVELVAERLDSPTSMRFLDDGTLLVLKKIKVRLDSCWMAKF
ncbi:MAG: hypothetical protein M3232_04745 [Thermoproteota archaeon]|nr:hypothetical protein [Thermoproteota archaeon]